MRNSLWNDYSRLAPERRRRSNRNPSRSKGAAGHSALLADRVRTPVSTPPTASPAVLSPSTSTKASALVTLQFTRPSTRSRTRQVLALRHSPENPFLATNSKHGSSSMSPGYRKIPRTPQRHAEKLSMASALCVDFITVSINAHAETNLLDL